MNPLPEAQQNSSVGVKPLPMFVFIALAGLILVASAAPARAAAPAYTLNWNTNQNRVSADIKSAPLLSVLGRIAGATRWKIFVEPGTGRTVSTKFKDLPPGEALSFLLGDLNFALVPGSNSPSRLFVFRTGRDNATQLVAPAGPGAKKIPNELIVRLKPGADIDEIARKLGAKVVGRLDKLNAYRLRFDDEAAADAAREQLASNQDVASVDSNYVLDRPPIPGGALNQAVLPQLQLKPPPSNGRVVVGLVDTAVQPLGNNLDQFIQKQLSVVGSAQLEPGVPSHGTAMAETMLGSIQQATGGSTSVQIIPVDVYGSAETTSSFDVALGIVRAVDAGANVINLSLGSPGDNPVLHDVVRQASAAGILLIGAAGNDPVTTPYYPAAYPEVHAVTAIDQGQIASYANRGSFVSLGAPGMNVFPFGNIAYGVEGTSVSSAILSGLAAGFMEANHATTTQAQTFLQSNFGIRIVPRGP
jgi:Subtilase family